MGSGHGPVMGSRCVWEALDKSIWSHGKSENGGEFGWDVVCVYQHAMMENLGSEEVSYAGKVRGGSLERKGGINFFITMKNGVVVSDVDRSSPSHKIMLC